MPSRRFHIKSRAGCNACKRAKVKCNEVRPSCDRCTRISVTCEYSQQQQRDSSKDSQGSHSTGATSSHNTTPLLPSDPVFDAPITSNETTLLNPSVFSSATASFSHHPSSHGASVLSLSADPIPPTSTPQNSAFTSPITDIELMHHYTSSTYATLSDPHQHTAWQSAVPTLAFAHPFLLHSILALSALHKASLSPTSTDHRGLRYLNTAVQHNDHAITLTKAAIAAGRDGDADTAAALFAASITLFVFAMGYWTVADTTTGKGECRTSDETTDDSIASVAQIAHLVSGAAGFATRGIETIRGGSLRALLADDVIASVTSSFGLGGANSRDYRGGDGGVEESFAFLEMEIRDVIPDPVERGAHGLALRNLRTCFQVKEMSRAVVFFWLATLPPPFLEGLERGGIIAGAMVGMWGVLVERLLMGMDVDEGGWAWWCVGWGGDIVQDIQARILRLREKDEKEHTEGDGSGRLVEWLRWQVGGKA